jgi:hypothetical protein
MKIRFLFNRVALDAGGIAIRHAQQAILVVTHFANAPLAWKNYATVTTGKAAQFIVFELFIQLALDRGMIKGLLQGYTGHKKHLFLTDIVLPAERGVNESSF